MVRQPYGPELVAHRQAPRAPEDGAEPCIRFLRRLPLTVRARRFLNTDPPGALPSPRPAGMRAPLTAGPADPVHAAIAQLVEHLIRNEGVGGSNPSCGTILLKHLARISPRGAPQRLFWGCTGGAARHFAPPGLSHEQARQPAALRAKHLGSGSAVSSQGWSVAAIQGSGGPRVAGDIGVCPRPSWRFSCGSRIGRESRPRQRPLVPATRRQPLPWLRPALRAPAASPLPVRRRGCAPAPASAG